MTKRKYSFQDKMNSAEPEGWIYSGKPTKKRAEAIAFVYGLDTEDAKNSIVKYLGQFKSDIAKLYKWKFSTEKLDFLEKEDRLKIENIPGEQNFERELVLKRLLSKYLNEKQNDHYQIAEWIIKDWGGIKTGKEINKAIDKLFSEETECISLPFERIASMSKVAAFKHPDKCIIYDSRVAYSLNWILLSAGVNHKYFPIPEGRNSKMTAFDMNVLIHLVNKKNYFSSNPEKESKSFISQRDNDIYLEKDYAYEVLNHLISIVSQELWKGDPEKQKNLFYTEMLLFSIADTHVIQDIIKRTILKID